MEEKERRGDYEGRSSALILPPGSLETNRTNHQGSRSEQRIIKGLIQKPDDETHGDSEREKNKGNRIEMINSACKREESERSKKPRTFNRLIKRKRR